jgi:hypothetical protein
MAGSGSSAQSNAESFGSEYGAYISPGIISGSGSLAQ